MKERQLGIRKRRRRGTGTLRLEPAVDSGRVLTAFLATLSLEDAGLESLLAARVERQWVARGLSRVRPVTGR